MDETTRQSHRLILFTEHARYDLAGIDNATYQQWGEAQAERYLAYLRETFAYLTQEPTLSEPLQEWPGYWVYTVKYRKKRSAQVHRIFER